jgi:transcriptional regulator with XRE-family HTH domain
MYISLGINLEREELEVYSEHILDIVSRNVIYYRKKQKLSQMQLALDIGMSGGAYLGRAEIRKDKHHFNIKHLAKISKILEVDICEFFTDIQKNT